MPAVVASVVVLTLIVISALGFALRRQHRALRRQARHSGEVTKRLDHLDSRMQKSNKDRQADVAAQVAQAEAIGKVVERIEQEIVHLRRTSAGTPRAITDEDMTSPGRRALAELVFDGSVPRVNLVLQHFTADNVFAGVRTACVAAAEIAAQLDLALHVLVFEHIPEPRDIVLGALRSTLDESGHSALVDRLTLSIEGAREPRGHHPDDVWIATFWPTAWNLNRLAGQGRIRADRTVYLVQDWEPNFYPAGDLQAKALSTYDAGFLVVVNSAPLARYLADHSSALVDPEAVFGPEIETKRLSDAATHFRPAAAGEIRLLFYARPSKPRNMLTLGLQAIRAWADMLPSSATPVVYLAGEDLGEVDLGDRVRVETLGKTTLAGYYELLANTDLGLALMYSAHPGHLALELPLAGIPTVTNALGPYRESWVSGLTVAQVSADAIARALLDLSATQETHTPGEFLVDLGPSMATAIGVVTERLRRAVTSADGAGRRISG